MRDHPRIKLFVVTTSMVFGGAEIMLLELLKGIDRTKFDVTLCVLKAEQGLQSRFESIGYKTHAFPVGLTWSGLKSLAGLVSLFLAIRPDIVQSWMYRADFYACFLKLLRPKTKLVWSVHNCDLSLSRNGLSRWILVKACAVLSWVFPNAIAYCATSAIASHKAFGFRELDALYIPNGFDADCFKKISGARETVCTEVGLNPALPVVGSFGRFDPQKNHTGLLDLVAVLHKRGLKIQLLLAGGGVDGLNGQLAAQTKRLGLSGYVRLLGVREDVPRLMSALDLYVSFSLGEAFPLVLGEAMLCETPVIATNCGDSSRLGLESWMITPVGNTDEAAEAIEIFFNLNEARREELGKRSRQFVVDNFSIKNTVTTYSNLYRSLVS